uniref:hypothetical protein n=1 Tax=uncultured Draconibacterium sp. TaxID=1573823 RepID=UPI00321718DE
MQQRVKQYYTACTDAGIDGKERLKERFGLDSANDASPEQLGTLIYEINEEGNKWRRRVMAAIGDHLEGQKKECNANIIKAIACRAAKAKHFNRISHESLRAIYNQFSKPVKK